ncbi:hypothetical protein BYT27DRAFT_6650507 [Phlegmacium glaucopus]|nr:hypothetical protein BYT27DRAFT_6650507 [Phlegmacium glaucopus]
MLYLRFKISTGQNPALIKELSRDSSASNDVEAMIEAPKLLRMLVIFLSTSSRGTSHHGPLTMGFFSPKMAVFFEHPPLRMSSLTKEDNRRLSRLLNPFSEKVAIRRQRASCMGVGDAWSMD